MITVLYMRLMITIVLLTSLSMGVRAAEPESPREAAKRIGELYRAEKWADAQTAIKALMRVPDERFAAATIGHLLNDTSLKGRASIVSDIGTMRFKAAVPHLIDRLEDSDPGVRQQSAMALGQIGDKSAIPFVARHLKTLKDDEKYRVRLALAQLGEPYIGYYIDGLRDRAPRRRYTSAIALIQLKDPRAIPALVKRLDSTDSDDVRNARWALSATTSVRDADEIGKTQNGDGTFSTSLRFRELADFRKDIEAWVARNRDVVNRAIESPAERWDFTKEPELPGFHVSFTMSPAEVKASLDKAGVKWQHHPEIKADPPRINASSPERIDVIGQSGFKQIWDIRFVFKDGRLEEVRFMAEARDHELSELKGLLKLRSNGVSGWTGLDGAIRVGESHGDSEKYAYSIALNYRPN